VRLSVLIHNDVARARATYETLVRLSDALGVTCEHWRKFLGPTGDAKPVTKKKPSSAVKHGRGQPKKK
jgi:hypothetical protein